MSGWLDPGRPNGFSSPTSDLNAESHLTRRAVVLDRGSERRQTIESNPDPTGGCWHRPGNWRREHERARDTRARACLGRSPMTARSTIGCWLSRWRASPVGRTVSTAARSSARQRRRLDRRRLRLPAARSVPRQSPAASAEARTAFRRVQRATTASAQRDALQLDPASSRIGNCRPSVTGRKPRKRSPASSKNQLIRSPAMSVKTSGIVCPKVSFRSWEQTAAWPRSRRPICSTARRSCCLPFRGAFTPTCSARSTCRVSSENAAEAIKSRGVDTIACLSVNDVFVMGAWGKSAGACRQAKWSCSPTAMPSLRSKRWGSSSMRRDSAWVRGRNDSLPSSTTGFVTQPERRASAGEFGLSSAETILEQLG